MPIEQRVTTLAVAGGILILILELVRKRRLREEYSWLWLLAGTGLIAAASWYEGVRAFAELIGTSTSSAVFFLGQIFIILVCLQFSVRLSRMTEQVKTLAQRLALLEAEKRELEARLSSSDDDV